MNASKLLNILEDILAEEDSYKINAQIDQLFTFIKQNNIEQADLKKNEIFKILDDSVANEYTKSNILIIEKIEEYNKIKEIFAENKKIQITNKKILKIGADKNNLLLDNLLKEEENDDSAITEG